MLSTKDVLCIETYKVVEGKTLQQTVNPLREMERLYQIIYTSRQKVYKR